MKKIILVFFGLLVLSCNQNKNEVIEETSVLNISKEKEKLRYLKEVEWPKAYKEQDTILLDRILGDDFQMVTNDGEWSNKAKQLERIKKTGMNHDSFKYEIKRLEILENNTAIIAGTGHIINDNKESIYQSSNILIKRNGVWKAVLSHVSGFKELE
ncbi:nuclear transport factor 2 family protein [Kordia sp.]|uniref:nuclear transport factor 2 family protein n=1 Tax=Kordia sp. TaxID=1965332 RepID=UPI003D6A6947